MTTIWNRWVRCHRPEWLEKPTFAMVELLLQPIDDPVSPEAADDILGIPLPQSQILKACQWPLDKRTSAYFVLQQFTP